MTGFGYNVNGFGAYASRGVGLDASAASSANLQTLFNNSVADSWASGTPKTYDIGAIDMGILTVPSGMGGTLEINIASGGTVRGVAGAAGSAGSAGSGNGQAGSAGGAGGAGGAAISVASTGVTINVVGSLQGGGGGGGGGGGAGSGGQGRTTNQLANICKYYYQGFPSQCTAGGSYAGSGQNCSDPENMSQYTCIAYVYHTGGTGGAGGAGSLGQGYNQAAGSGASGSNGSAASNAGTGGNGGAGGDGGAFGAASGAAAAGAVGANSQSNGGAGGAAGAVGAAGRAVLFVGISAYTIIGVDSGTIAGAYN